MKKILILILLTFSLAAACGQAGGGGNSDTSSDKVKEDKFVFKKPTDFQLTRLLYWSAYGTTAFTSFINTMAHTGYAAYVSEEMLDQFSALERLGVGGGESITDIVRAYPAIIFGGHFLASGLAGIPVAGGLLYGSFLYLGGIACAVVGNLSFLNFASYIPDGYSQKARISELYQGMLNPAPYFAVGTISILMGIGEIITYFFYNREVIKRKYPYIRKIFTFTPTSICIKLS